MGYLGAIVVEKFGKDTKSRGTASFSDEIYGKLAAFLLDADTLFHEVGLGRFSKSNEA